MLPRRGVRKDRRREARPRTSDRSRGRSAGKLCDEDDREEHECSEVVSKSQLYENNRVQKVRCSEGSHQDKLIVACGAAQVEPRNLRCGVTGEDRVAHATGDVDAAKHEANDGNGSWKFVEFSFLDTFAFYGRRPRRALSSLECSLSRNAHLAPALGASARIR